VAAPPLPNYPLKALFKLRDRILNEACFGLWYLPIEGAAYARLAAGLHAVLKSRAIPPAAILDALLPHVGDVLDGALGTQLAWRLAGNLAALKAGVPVGPWTCQRQLEWVPVQVLSGRPEVTRFGKAGYRYRLRYLAGTPAGKDGAIFWSHRQLAYLATDQLGFTGPKAKKQRPYLHPAQLVRLRFYALLEPELSLEAPAFRQVRVPAGLLAHNTAILDIRARLAPCPRRYPHPCHNCAIGYLEPKPGCPAACHPRQWAAGACPACGRADAPIDPDLDAARCVVCARRDATRKP
jgi:hypothetical protein